MSQLLSSRQNRFTGLQPSDIWQRMSVETITAIFVSQTEPVPGQRRVEVAWEESDQCGGAREKVKSNIVSLLGKQMLNPSGCSQI